MRENIYMVYIKQNNGKFRAWKSDTEQIEIINRLPNDTSNFYLAKSTKGYTDSDEDLARYGRDIKIACDELKTSKDITFDYITPYKRKDNTLMARTHQKNIETVFNMLATITNPLTNEKIRNYAHHEPITYEEHQWFSKCNNGGLQYSTTGIYDSYGYDFSNYYGSILASTEFKIPTKAGKPRKFTVIPKYLHFGFYNVKIECDNPDFKKIFAFSKDNVYTSYSLEFAQKVQDRFNIKIELVQDVEFNAYTYLKECLISSSEIFKKWHETILKLKKQFPKNILIKMLSSSLWGHLSRKNAIRRTEEEIEEQNLSIGISDKADYIIQDYVINDDGSAYYKLINSKNPYFYNLRLKPFITSFGRVKTGSIALNHIEKVLRIHTDSICYDEKMNLNIENFIPEDKTTGIIEFKNINNYTKIDF